MLTNQTWCSHRYEEEINRRTAAENEFVLLKKVNAGWGEGTTMLYPQRKSSGSEIGGQLQRAEKAPHSQRPILGFLKFMCIGPV